MVVDLGAVWVLGLPGPAVGRSTLTGFLLAGPRGGLSFYREVGFWTVGSFRPGNGEQVVVPSPGKGEAGEGG